MDMSSSGVRPVREPPAHRIGYAQMGGTSLYGLGWCSDIFDRPEGRGERGGVSGELSGGRICEELSLAADGKRKQPGDYWG